MAAHRRERFGDSPGRRRILPDGRLFRCVRHRRNCAGDHVRPGGVVPSVGPDVVHFPVDFAADPAADVCPFSVRGMRPSTGMGTASTGSGAHRRCAGGGVWIGGGQCLVAASTVDLDCRTFCLALRGDVVGSRPHAAGGVRLPAVRSRLDDHQVLVDIGTTDGDAATPALSVEDGDGADCCAVADDRRGGIRLDRSVVGTGGLGPEFRRQRPG